MGLFGSGRRQPRNGQAFIVSVRVEASGSGAGEKAAADLVPAVRDAAGLAARALREAGGRPVAVGAVFMQSAYPLPAARALPEALSVLDDLAGSSARAGLSVTVGVALGAVWMESRGWFRSGPVAAIGDPVGRSRCLAFLAARHGFPVLLDAAAGKAVPGARALDLYRSPDRAAPSPLYGLERLDPGFPADAFNRAFAEAVSAFYGGEPTARDALAACLAMKPGDPPTSDFMRLLDEGTRPPPPTLRWG